METLLTAIRDHHLHIWCRADHKASLAVAKLLAQEVPPRTVGDVMRRARCKVCGAGAADIILGTEGVCE